MLKVSADFVPAAQVKQEGQGVDVGCSADKDGNLPIRIQLRKQRKTHKQKHTIFHGPKD